MKALAYARDETARLSREVREKYMQVDVESPNFTAFAEAYFAINEVQFKVRDAWQKTLLW